MVDQKEPKGETITLNSLELAIPTSAKAMAAALTQLADDLRRAAELLKHKKQGETYVLPVTILCRCNSDGD